MASTKLEVAQLRELTRRLDEIRSAVKDEPGLPSGAATEETLAKLLAQADITLSNHLAGIVNGIAGTTPNQKTLYDVNSTLEDVLTELGLIAIDTGRIPTSPASESGKLSDIATYTARIPASPATEGGNLASVKTNTDKLDILLSALRDAIVGGTAKTLYDLWTRQGDGNNKVGVWNGSYQLPGGDATGRPIFVRQVDASANTPTWVQSGDNTGRGIQVFLGFVANPGAVATGKALQFLGTRNGTLFTVGEANHLTVQGYSNGWATPSAGIAVASAATVDLFAMAAQTTRLPIVTRLRVDVEGDGCLIQVSVCPTYKAGTSITGGIRYAQGASASNALVVYSPTVTAQGNVIDQGIANDDAPYILNIEECIAMGYNGKILNVRAISRTSGGAGSTAWVSAQGYEVSVA